MPLFDEQDERIPGKENGQAARLARPRVKLVDESSPPPATSAGEWTVAKLCEIQLADLHQSATLEWTRLVEKWLNDSCGHCGALEFELFQKKHLRAWIQRHKSWNHNTHRNAITPVNAASDALLQPTDLHVATEPIAKASFIPRR